MLDLEHKIVSLNFYLEILSSILCSRIRTNRPDFDFQMWISKVMQFPLVSEQAVQYIQHCTKHHCAFPCHAYKGFHLKGRYFSCLALTLQLSLFRQNSVS